MTFKDQLNRTMRLGHIPKRIVSTVPSQTEFLFDIGLENSIVGITNFCIHPREKYKQTPHIGGTKKLDIEKIRKLKPDFIIANKEENTQQDMELLMKEFPVWVSEIYTLEDAIEMMKSLGEILDKHVEVDILVSEILTNFSSFKITLEKANLRHKKCAYLIWKKPWMAVGHPTFINNMLTDCWKFTNIFGSNDRYPEIDIDALKDAKLDYLFLSSEPYPFKEKEAMKLQKEFQQTKVVLVDGEMFSWYGSRLKQTPLYFASLLSSLSV